MSRDLENKKCQSILKTGKDLFWKHGVKRVSIQEICKEAKTSKMTFYKFFDNKIDLAKTILDLLFEEGRNEYKAIMAQDIPFVQKVKETLLMEAKNSQGLSQEFIVDVYKNNDLGLLEYINVKGEVMMDLVLDDYEQAQKDGHVRPDIKRAFMRYQLLKMQGMISDEDLLVHYENPQELAMELTNFFFYGLLVNDNE
jgi:AcrR family transcriptional regulator